MLSSSCIWFQMKICWWFHIFAWRVNEPENEKCHSQSIISFKSRAHQSCNNISLTTMAKKSKTKQTKKKLRKSHLTTTTIIIYRYTTNKCSVLLKRIFALKIETNVVLANAWIYHTLCLNSCVKHVFLRMIMIFTFSNLFMERFFVASFPLSLSLFLRFSIIHLLHSFSST